MYRSVYYNSSRSEIHLWGDGQHDDSGYKVFKYEPYAYIVDKNGDCITIDNHRCKKVSTWSPEAEKMGMVYEHNVSPTTRFLIDKYLDSDKVSDQTKILYLDIEVAKEDAYSTPEDADNTVTAITYVATGDDKYTCLLLDPGNASTKNTTVDIQLKKKENGQIVDGETKTIDVDIITFHSERELLRSFMMRYQKIGHNIITGWNVEFFDMPYLYNRIVKLFDYAFADLFSPDAKIVKRTYLKERQTISIAGVTIYDYLTMYRKFTFTDQSNYRLDTIAKFELYRGKIEYEGDLDHLYKTDIVKFAKYNIVDVELVVALEEKMRLIMTGLGLCHKGHVQHQDILFTSMYLDGAFLTYCKRNNMVASANRSAASGKAQGAFVRKPTPGLYKWVYDLDLTSLYPSIIISLNISPETKVGIIESWDELEYAKGTQSTYNVNFYSDNTVLGNFDDSFDESKPMHIELQGSSNLKKWLDENEYGIASNGVIYDQKKEGVIPAILKMWFDERSEYKNLRKKYEKEGDIKNAEYYDGQQLITKILLNSFYGVLLLPSFRFYDKQNGEAVTLTGQSVIHHSSKAADHFYNKELGIASKTANNKSFCIYTDTDSIFEPLEPLFINRFGPMENYTDAEIIEKSKGIINDVQTYINKSFDVYAKRLHNINSHRWDIKQELIAKRAFWVGNTDTKSKKFEGVKKRYAMWIVDQEGHRVDEMDVKGLDVVRSNFPPLFRDFMNGILTDILHDADKDTLNEKVRTFKKNMYSVDYKNIMMPTGVKDIEKYTTGRFGVRKKGTPAHVNAALNYNDLLNKFKNTAVPNIVNGDKIIWTYIKRNQLNFDRIALKGFEDDERIVEFVEKYIDHDTNFDNYLLNKLQNFWSSLGWGPIQLNAIANKFFKF